MGESSSVRKASPDKYLHTKEYVCVCECARKEHHPSERTELGWKIERAFVYVLCYGRKSEFSHGVL